MLNDVVYEMAEANTNLAEALDYSQRSIGVLARVPKAAYRKLPRPDEPKHVVSHCWQLFRVCSSDSSGLF
jgi:hypothetical protein